MTTKRILFIGGTGVISTGCVSRALQAGHDVSVLNRGSTGIRPLPDGARSIVADVRDAEGTREALDAVDGDFDVVADFLSYTTDHVRTSMELFEGRTGQYVFISSASAYQKPPSRLPVTESTPLRNPYSAYARDKIACEDLLVGAYRDRGFPATIVRPSHTYDETSVPTLGGWTDIARMRAGKPVIVQGDGTSLWAITHVRDFAVGFVGLLGLPAAVGDVFHLTGDHTPTWNQIYSWMGGAAGVEPDLVHVASETIADVHPDWAAGLLGDRTHSMVFDNSKIKALVPDFRTTVTFDEGAREIIAWYDAHPERQIIDPAADAAFERVLALPRR
ncbi:NAD-dependent epimerase/dehydratase family protein [Microbacterium sp. 179-I 3D3 NHS]|uniref:NAD-dependent epimerase/dehydratase family protein n=1 Tax=unclassified Microbacterium TaxID=2609290 RepID=UPI0039A21C4A